MIRLPPLDHLPDAVFVEDTAVVLPDRFVLARPGAAPRRPEVASLEAAISGPATSDLATAAATTGQAAGLPPAGHRIVAPGTLDGGDVLRLDDTVWVGATARTNPEGMRQLERILSPLGYRVRSVSVDGCLHLKTAVTGVADDAVVLNPAWVDPGCFAGLRVIEVDATEPYAANVLRIGEVVIMSKGFPRTRDRLAAHGMRVEEVDIRELAKAEGGVTCCSLVLPSAGRGRT